MAEWRILLGGEREGGRGINESCDRMNATLLPHSTTTTTITTTYSLFPT